MSKRTYDSTVARIAGNILSGYGFSNFSGAVEPGPYTVDAFDLHNVSAAVAIARAIVAEVQRTEPLPAAEGD